MVVDHDLLPFHSELELFGSKPRREENWPKGTGQFVDKPTRSQSSRWLVISQTSQLAETFYL